MAYLCTVEYNSALLCTTVRFGWVPAARDWRSAATKDARAADTDTVEDWRGEDFLGSSTDEDAAGAAADAAGAAAAWSAGVAGAASCASVVACAWRWK